MFCCYLLYFEAAAGLCFPQCDVDQNGTLCPREMRGAVQQLLGLKIPARFDEQLYATFDRNGDGAVDFTEFVAVVRGGENLPLDRYPANLANQKVLERRFLWESITKSFRNQF